MQKNFQQILRLLTISAALLSVIGITACVPGISFPNFDSLEFKTTADIQPSNPVIQVGKNQQFTIVLNGDRNQVGDPSRFNWTSSQPAIALVSASGLATGLTSGAATIKIVAKDDSTISASTTLTVSAATSAVQEVAGGAGSLVFTVADTERTLGYSVDKSSDQVRTFLRGSDGEMRATGFVELAAGSGPTWLAIQPSGKFLYVLNQKANTVSSFLVDPWTGQLAATAQLSLTKEDSSRSSRANTEPISVDAAGEVVFVGRSGHRQVAYRINSHNGSLTIE